MKKLIIAALIAFYGLPAWAQSGGFHAGEPPPPPNKQASGYKGSVDSRHISVKDAKKMKDKTWVTLEGNIVKKVGDDKYAFRDGGDTVILTIAGDKWNGQDVSPKDLVSVSGHIRKDRHGTGIEVGHILKQ